MRKTYTIDGKHFNDINGFYQDITDEIITEGKGWWGRNLDAFNDILSGGFGTPEDGFVFIWKNSDLSKEKLGGKFGVLVEIIKNHKDIDLRLE